MKIRIEVPADRRKLGWLTIVGTPFGCACYLKADNAAAAKSGNPTRDPTRRNGDTPLGTYRAVVGKAYAWSPRTYGPYRVVRLEPTGGDALTAKQNGRSGLLIHGGDLASDGRSLRPTHGCVRVSNYHQAALLVYLDASGEAEHQLEIVPMKEVENG